MKVGILILGFILIYLSVTNKLPRVLNIIFNG